MKSTEEIWYALNNEFKDNNESKVLSIFLNYDMACDCYAAFNSDLESICSNEFEWENNYKINTVQKHIIMLRNCIKKIMRYDSINEEFESYQRTYPRFICYLWAYDNEFDHIIEYLYKNKDRSVVIELLRRVINKFEFAEEETIWRENYEQRYAENTTLF